MRLFSILYYRMLRFYLSWDHGRFVRILPNRCSTCLEKKKFKTALSILLILTFFSGCFSQRKPEFNHSDNQVRVLTTVEPIAWLVNYIGGSHVQTTVLVPKGKEPESFSPTPQMAAGFLNNKIFFRVGLASEQTLLPKLEESASSLSIIDLRKGLSLLPMDHQHFDHEQKEETDLQHNASEHKASEHNASELNAPDRNTHDHENDSIVHSCSEDGMDPHFWMSPELVKNILPVIRDELITAAPAYRLEYEKRMTELLNQLTEIQTAIRETLSSLPSKTILVFHPAYGYFCQEFGLKQIAVEVEGKSPRPKELATLIALVKEKKIHSIIVQPEFNQNIAQSVTEALKIRAVYHSPLEANYLNNIQNLTQIIKESFQASDIQTK